MGIAHDTGVFQYTCTSSKTMQIAGKLMDKGIAFTDILDKTYFENIPSAPDHRACPA